MTSVKSGLAKIMWLSFAFCISFLVLLYPKKRAVDVQSSHDGQLKPHVKTDNTSILDGSINYKKDRDEYERLLFGVELDELKSRLYVKGVPFTYDEAYKNPCWLERLTPDFGEEYEQTQYKGRGREAIAIMSQVFKERLDSSARPWRFRCLPYFYLIGVTKSGTTDLFNMISKHGSVHRPWIKEPMYWNRARYPDYVVVHKASKIRHMCFKHYVNYFDLAAHMINSSFEGHSHVMGDGSSFLFWEDNGWQSHPDNKGLTEPRYTTAMALHTAQPEAKLILILRNPTDRVYSAYNMHMFEMKQNSSARHFKTLAVASIRSYEQCFSKYGVRSCVYNGSLYRELFPMTLRASLYSIHLRDWLKVFPQEQLFVIKSEDYYADRLPILNKMFTFLDIGPLPSNVSEEIARTRVFNKANYQSMLPQTRAILDRFFKPFNKELEDMLHRRFWQ